MHAIMAMIQIHTAIVIQMTPAVPPFNRPNMLESSEDSHVACRIDTNPTMEKKRKFRYQPVSCVQACPSRKYTLNSCFFPIRNISC